MAEQNSRTRVDKARQARRALISSCVGTSVEVKNRTAVPTYRVEFGSGLLHGRPVHSPLKPP
ncbi:hypothetical protein SAMN05443245_7002 [Paraburkholderia fungorum]|uniref:Uncharacterized protein n=1 Tax=Paraburkholderia fungorum TaxID=134537 RepID=A0A1H1JPY7_9BURK|nr:hypothetical protein SAMN05443245_7002 [Paraburkholderia fungorum]